MRAGRGGEHAAPAAHHQGDDSTNIYQLSRHGFYFERLINTRGRRLSIRERTNTPTGYYDIQIIASTRGCLLVTLTPTMINLGVVYRVKRGSQSRGRCFLKGLRG
jgi:hypothetical protein